MPSAQVLIADDNAVNRRLIASAMSRLGFESRETEDGLATLTSCLKKKPDLLIIDIHMPAMNGLDVIQRLRIEYPSSVLPILVLTADTELPSSVVLKAGANDLLHKPLDLGDLHLKVRDLLDNPFSASPA